MMMVVNWLDYPLKAQLDIPPYGVPFQFDYYMFMPWMASPAVHML